jgi:tRNA1Val (adenine37-N6)-methyltransferase
MSVFHFKYFSISQSNSALKVGTDSMLLGSFLEFENPKYALDIGSGTGVLSLMFCQKYSNVKIDSVEIDSKSFIDLEYNVSQSHFKNRINVFEIDFFNFQTNQLYDVVFSNPPYYDDGVKFINNETYHSKHSNFFSKSIFFERVTHFLSKNGFLWIIVPYKQGEKWINEASNVGLILHRKIIIEGKPYVKIRSILVFSTNYRSKHDEISFVVRDENGFYTPEYQKLTAEFHNKMPIK